jgi:hypothetical protein
LTIKKATVQTVDTVRASRGGHTFHERWAARRALQLVFPQDRLKAIAVEGLSTRETAEPGAAAEEIADLVLYYGDGANFATSEVVQTAQFKYKTTLGAVTASYLRKTIEKFAGSIIGYGKDFSAADVDKKLTFAFVTNAEFSPQLWEAIKGLKSGSPPTEKEALGQHDYLAALCEKVGVDAQRLFSRCEFRASEEALPALNSALRRTIADWSAGADFRAKARVFDLAELVREKAGPLGVDTGEEIATCGAASRPRLGVELTAKFGLIADANCREWKTTNNELALRSQVWGEWVPDADNLGHLRNENGEILWAAPDWLDRTLPKFDRQLVYTVTLQKYKSNRSYSDASGAKAIYVGTRAAGKSIRFWFAKKASATTY